MGLLDAFKSGFRQEFNKNAALVIVDVQKFFAEKGTGLRGNDDTEKISAKIAEILPEVRAAGIPVYFVGYQLDAPRYKEDIGTFYKSLPLPDEKVIYKTDDSAFSGSNIDEILKKDGIRHLLICGFNYSYCVRDTATDACKKDYKVTLLTDLACNGATVREDAYGEATKVMKKAHVVLAKSTKVLPAVMNARKTALQA